MPKHQIVELRYSARQPFRNIRAERLRRAERQLMLNNLAWLTFFFVLTALYVMLASQ